MTAKVGMCPGRALLRHVIMGRVMVMSIVQDTMRGKSVEDSEPHLKLGRRGDSSVAHIPVPSRYPEVLSYKGSIISTRSGMESH